MMGKLSGKVALITGSSRGIGRYMAIEFAKEGCAVVVAARSDSAGDPRLPGTIHTVAEELRALGAPALAVKTDVSSDADITACVAAALAAFGRIDILVNNAGLLFPGPFHAMPVKRADLTYRVNVRAPVLFSQAVLPGMLEQGGGTIISISSKAADMPSSDSLLYGMSKSAIEKLAEGIAEGYGKQGIRSFGLKPRGLVITPGSTYAGVPDVVAEPAFAMGRAALWLCTSEQALARNGDSFVSLDVLAMAGEAVTG